MSRHVCITEPCLVMSRQCLDVSTQWLDMSRHIFVMPMVFSMAPLHSLGPNDQNEVKHDFFRYLVPLVPALLACDTNWIIKDIISFIRWRQLKWDVHNSFGHAMLLAKVWTPNNTNGTVNGTIAFVSSRWSKWDANWLFSYLTLGTGISIMEDQCHCQ